MTTNYCPSCHVAWQDHPSNASLCAELKAARAEAVELRKRVIELRELVDALTSSIESNPEVMAWEGEV